MKYLFTVWLSFVVAVVCKATVVMPPLFADHMVMQQNVPVKIWGKAKAGERVTININSQTIGTTTNVNGKWVAWLNPLKSSKPLEMTISGSDNAIHIKDILVGEVWLASGQSNMEWKVRQSVNADEEIKAANYPMIRLFVVHKGFGDAEAEEVQGKWELCSPATVGSFSAVAYFFGRDLFKQRPGAIGLIEADWGATNCQAWTPLATINADPRCQYINDNWKKYVDQYPQMLDKFKATLQRYQADSLLRKANGDTTPAPRAPTPPHSKDAPGSIYNVMIAPMAGFTIKGVIWYQGEANAYQYVAYPYRYLFPDMITAWRKVWGQGDFPFLFVQLSGMTKHPYWPVLRESQSETLKLINTGMAVSQDMGDSTNAHYLNKQVIGHRLYLTALNSVYHQPVEFSGPVYKQVTAEDKGLRLWFEHADGLKAADEKTLRGFTIAGSDGNFVPGVASIEGTTLLVSGNTSGKPVAVRYAFTDWPAGNLVNSAGLPASCFRTDSFEIK